MQTTDLAYLSVAETGRLFRARQLSPVELTRTLLDRAEEFQPDLHAFVTLTPELALQQARAAEAALLSRDPARTASPLLGIPIGYKDILQTRGIRTTAGCERYAGFVPETDATVVVRWRAAGTVTLGKLMTHELAMTLQPPEHRFPAARNPWNLDHVPGGSSSGSGAALAAGLVLGAIGSDTGGSIRNPASYCAVSGLKPTYGRVSRHGVVPLSWTMDHIGPMARSVEDLALLLRPLAGHDPLDPTSATAPVPDYAAALGDGVCGLRIGMPANLFFDGCEDEVRGAVLAAAEVLRGAGAEVREIALPHAELAPVATVIMFAEAYAYHAADLAEHAEQFSRPGRSRLLMGALFSAGEYVQAQRARELLRRSFAEAMRPGEGVDLLLTPSNPTPAPTYQAALEANMRRRYSYTGAFNLTGQPSLTIPCGLSAAGLPIGLMLSGRPFEEPTVLRAGHAYQRATDWHERRASSE